MKATNALPMPKLIRRIAQGVCCVGLTIVLCSCQGPSRQAAMPGSLAGPASAAGYAISGDESAGGPCPVACPCVPCGPPGMEQGVPLPYVPVNPELPPGLSGEYVCDGGDYQGQAGVLRSGEVVGLEMEDTVAHYDTLDGRTMLEPTNRVCVYAPRFASARQVVSLIQNEQAAGPAGISKPLRLNQQEYARGPGVSTQNLQAIPEIGTKSLTIYRRDVRAGGMSQALKATGFQDAFQPFENFTLIRSGQMLESEGAVLAKGALAAIAWSGRQSVEVILDRQSAMVEVQNESVQSVYTVKKPPSCPRLRVCKVASTPFAEPGDTVSFTIRFDNVGNEAIGNVTIVDNLSPRLEFVPDSSQCSVDAQFFNQPNEGGSLVLRWEIEKPLEVGQGGVLRFNCRVR